jgi:hypothetical protein
MQQEEALDFYKRITEGKKRYQEIALEHASGAALEGVELHPVDKKTLAGTIQNLPDEMFDAVEDAESAEEAEKSLEEDGGSLSAVSADTVEAFEDLCKNSLRHPELTSSQMGHIVKELNFEVLFEVGTEIINISSTDTGGIRAFQKQE